MARMVARYDDKGKSALFVAQGQSERLFERPLLKISKFGIDCRLSNKRTTAIKRKKVPDETRDIGSRLRQWATNVI